MAVFNAGNVTSEETCSVFDIALTELLRFADFSEPFPDFHDGKANSYRGEGQSACSRMFTQESVEGEPAV